VRTIAFAAAKGGTGKSTLVAASATAATYFEPEAQVGVVDLDPQGSFTRCWNDRGKPLPLLLDVEVHAVARAREQLRGAALDWLFLDCPPGFTPIGRTAIESADLVLVVTGPGKVDLSAVASTVEMAQAAGTPFRFVLNGGLFRSRLVGRAVTALRGRGGLLWPPVHRRVAIAEAMETGLTAVETEPRGAAARELQALWLAAQVALGAAPLPWPDDPPATQGRRR
jgi:chromosome partitioning protein